MRPRGAPAAVSMRPRVRPWVRRACDSGSNARVPPTRVRRSARAAEVPPGYDAMYKRYAAQGARVIALAVRPLGAEQDVDVAALRTRSRDELETQLTWAGFAIFSVRAKSSKRPGRPHTSERSPCAAPAARAEVAQLGASHLCMSAAALRRAAVPAQGGERADAGGAAPLVAPARHDHGRRAAHGLLCRQQGACARTPRRALGTHARRRPPRSRASRASC